MFSDCFNKQLIHHSKNIFLVLQLDSVDFVSLLIVIA